MESDTDPDLARRFDYSWKALENRLRDLWKVDRELDGNIDALGLIDWAAESGLITRSSVAFLHRCRQARNAYAHVSYDGYDGPIGIPPREITYRLERISNAVNNPPLVTAVAPIAATCTADTPISNALTLMRSHNFSQLPYWGDEQTWFLITRSQVALWVEKSAERDGACLLDLTLTVQHLAQDLVAGAAVPIVAAPDTLLTAAVRQLEQALVTTRSEVIGYPVILVHDGDPKRSPRILATDDLPRAYEVLGR